MPAPDRFPTGPVTLRDSEGRIAAHGQAQEKVPPHCNGVWITDFRWADGYRPPRSTDTPYQLVAADGAEQPALEGRVSPDASDLTDVRGGADGVCFTINVPESG